MTDELALSAMLLAAACALAIGNVNKRGWFDKPQPPLE